MADDTNTAEREAVARAIWALMREHEDRCDEELEDLSRYHPVWEYADAARASLAASAGSEPVAWPPLQLFESPRAKILMRAWQEGWDACRDAEYVGEDAQNDAFNQSSTVNHCVAEDMLYTHPSPPEGAGWMPIAEAPQNGRTLLLGYFNSAGKWRTTRGQWMSQDYIDEYAEDPDCMSPGWYETTVEDDDGKCWPIDPTHYMPLPAPPLPASEAKEAGQ